MSDDYWKNRKKWDRIHGRGENGSPTEAARPVPPPKPIPPPPVFESPQAEIEYLRGLCAELWELIGTTALMDGKETSSRLYKAVDRKLRELRIVGLDSLPSRKK